MTDLAPKRPIPFYAPKSDGGDKTKYGVQMVLNDDNSTIFRIQTDPGMPLEGITARKRWLLEGTKRAAVAYRITCVTQGQVHCRMWNDKAGFDNDDPPFRDEHRPVGFIGGNFNPTPGWHHMDADVPDTVWYCCFLKGKRVKTGTVPTYIELNQGDQLPVYSTDQPNMYLLLEGELNMVGVGNIPSEARSIRGDIGSNRVVTKIGPGPAKLIHCFLEDEDYGRLD